MTYAPVFEIDDEVYIHPQSSYFGEHAEMNPANVRGVVYRNHNDWGDDHFIGVKWETNHTNVYRPRDLMHALSQSPLRPRDMSNVSL